MAPRDAQFMQQALQLARRGEGLVEPNPMVGAVLVNNGKVVGQGWHQRFGGPHAEVEAFRDAGDAARGATLYVTLEPCCHHGKTPPCSEAILAAGVQQVVVAQEDPFKQVAGGGIRQLRAAGIDVSVGLLQEEATALCAPYLKLQRTGLPWVIAKWAMTLDGKLATATGNSQWISNEESRKVVHQLRGRMDAILVGKGTALADDPRLTARPSGPRQAVRIVLDSEATISTQGQLARTALESPVLLAVGTNAPQERCQALSDAGCEVFRCAGRTHEERLGALLTELGRRRMTNLLVEGGAETLGSFFDASLVDQVHVFIAPKIAGGHAAPSPVAGTGIPKMADAINLIDAKIETLGSDCYIQGRCGRRK